MRFSSLIVIALLLCSGCDRAPTAGETGAVYRHALDGAPTSLDPAHAANVYASAIVVNLYDTLYRYRYLARPYELAPNLALGLPELRDEGRIQRIRLRPGFHFIDHPAFAEGRGREVVADDVVFSLQRHFDPATRSRGAWLWRGRIVDLEDWAERGADYDDPVAGLVVVDHHTLDIHLTRPFPQLAYTLATALAAIVPREAVDHYGRELGINAVGSGPFKLVTVDETRAVLRRNPGFDRGPIDLAAEGFDPTRHGELDLEWIDGLAYPLLEQLEFHFISEPSVRWTSFASGREVQNVMLPNEQALRLLESRDPIRFRPHIAERYHSLAEQESGFVFYGFNMANPAIGHHADPARDAANRALRCAIRDAYDWQARNDAFHHGLAVVFPGAIPPHLPDFDPALPPDSVSHDPARARARLAEHGWTSDTLPSLRFGLDAGVQQRQMFDQLRAFLAVAGLPEQMIEARQFATFSDLSRAVSQRELDLFMMSWTLAYPDAQYALQLFYGPNAAPGANKFNYANPAFDRLFEAASVLSDGPERRALHRRLNDMVIDDCVAISGLARTRLHLWRREVSMLPDRETVNGYFLRFVGIRPDHAAP